MPLPPLPLLLLPLLAGLPGQAAGKRLKVDRLALSSSLPGVVEAGEAREAVAGALAESRSNAGASAADAPPEAEAEALPEQSRDLSGSREKTSMLEAREAVAGALAESRSSAGASAADAPPEAEAEAEALTDLSRDLSGSGEKTSMLEAEAEALPKLSRDLSDSGENTSMLEALPKLSRARSGSSEKTSMVEAEMLHTLLAPERAITAFATAVGGEEDGCFADAFEPRMGCKASCKCRFFETCYQKAVFVMMAAGEMGQSDIGSCHSSLAMLTLFSACFFFAALLFVVWLRMMTTEPQPTPPAQKRFPVLRYRAPPATNYNFRAAGRVGGGGEAGGGPDAAAGGR